MYIPKTLNQTCCDFPSIFPLFLRGFTHLSAPRCCFKALRKRSGCCQLLLKMFVEQEHAWSSMCLHTLLCVILQMAVLFLIACGEVKITI